MNEIELKPCPFCGQEAELVGRNGGKEFRVQCTNQNCEARSKGSADRTLAVLRWNRRTTHE